MAQMHERQMTFFNKDGHDHDGENSTPVKLVPGSVGLSALDPALLDLLQGGGSDTAAASDGVMPVPDLTITTNGVAPGGYVTGIVPWVTLAVVRYMRIVMATDSECTITFYHNSTFADQDREFRAQRCANKFLWEGAWVHYDETGDKNCYYKVENTGLSTTNFKLILKSGTMTANAYSRHVESIQVAGNSTAPFESSILLIPGNGMTITPDSNNRSFKFDAVAPTTVNLTKWTLTPVKPASSTWESSVGSITNATFTGAGTSQVTFGTGPQWIICDLGSVKNLGRIRTYMYEGDGRIYNDVKLEISSDKASWITVKTAGPYWATGDGFNVEIPGGILARYIKLSSNGSSVDTSNHIAKIVAFALSDRS